MRIRPAAHYDKAYFDKWYRHPKHRVKSKLDIERQLRFIVSATEYIFERPIRKVLDVGAGEGNWSVALKKLRPSAKYYGVDPSEYAVKRFGKRRNIREGGFGNVGDLRLPGGFDIILCCGVMNYVADDDLASGLRQLTALCEGVAYCEVFAAEDDATGDFTRSSARTSAWWRQTFHSTGWESLGMHLYLRSDMASVATSLERAR